MRSHWPATVFAAALLAGPLAGCGEKGEPETAGPVVPATTTSQKGPEKGPQKKPNGGGGGFSDGPVRRAITTFLTAGDPMVCEQYATARFIRTAYGDLKGCEAAQRPGSAAMAVRVTAITFQNGSVSATAIPRGGANDGEKLRVQLVGQGESWMIDSLRSNAPVGP